MMEGVVWPVEDRRAPTAPAVLASYRLHARTPFRLKPLSSSSTPALHTAAARLPKVPMAARPSISPPGEVPVSDRLHPSTITSRRDFLRKGATAAVALPAIASLTACSDTQ